MHTSIGLQSIKCVLTVLLHSMIGHWHHNTVVCLSVSLSVTMCTVGLGVGVSGWKLYHRVTRTALPIHFFGYFYRRMYRSATAHSEKANRRNLRVWNSYGQRGHDRWLFQTRHFRRFGSAAIYCTSYAVRSAFLATATLLVLFAFTPFILLR